MKKIIVLLVVLLLLALTVQVALAHHEFPGPPPEFPEPPVDPPTGGSCNMNWWAIWDDENQIWVPLEGPSNGNANVEPGERGMFHVHNSLPHGESIGGANMFSLTGLHCGE